MFIQQISGYRQHASGDAVAFPTRVQSCVRVIPRLRLVATEMGRGDGGSGGYVKNAGEKE